MKKWGLLSIIVAATILGSCGSDKKESEASNDSFYNQFITSDNGVDNGISVSAVNLQLSGFQSFNGSDQIINDWKLKLDKNGTFYIYTNVNAVSQGGNDAPLLYGKGGDYSIENGVLTLSGVGRSQTAALNSVNSTNTFTYDMCSQASTQNGCMNLFIDSEIELSQGVQGSFSSVTGRMIIPGSACYQVCRK